MPLAQRNAPNLDVFASEPASGGVRVQLGDWALDLSARARAFADLVFAATRARRG
jgi:hypothetical protein